MDIDPRDIQQQNRHDFLNAKFPPRLKGFQPHNARGLLIYELRFAVYEKNADDAVCRAQETTDRLSPLCKSKRIWHGLKGRGGSFSKRFECVLRRARRVYSVCGRAASIL